MGLQQEVVQEWGLEATLYVTFQLSLWNHSQETLKSNYGAP